MTLLFAVFSPELCHLMVTVAKAAPSLHISGQFFLVCKHHVQQSVLYLQILDHPCQEVIISIPEICSLKDSSIQRKKRFFKDKICATSTKLIKSDF